MSSNYLKWPADKDDLIKISVYEDNIPVLLHKHDFIEIVYIAQGSCLHKYHDTEAMLIPGDVFIIVPHEEHSYMIKSRTVIYNCLFYPEALGEDWKKLNSISGVYDLLVIEPFFRAEQKTQEILHLQPHISLDVENLLARMLMEQKQKLPGFNLIQKANLIILLSMFGRSWESQFVISGQHYTARREMLTQALNYIESNYKNELKVRELASKVYLSPDYFRKLFKETTNLTPIEYINRVRISKAVKMLDEGMPVAKAAEIVGINDVNYFSRLFKLLMGYPPSMHKNNK